MYCLVGLVGKIFCLSGKSLAALNLLVAAEIRRPKPSAVGDSIVGQPGICADSCGTAPFLFVYDFCRYGGVFAVMP
ncbi:MAG: hypothetical protein ACLUKN_11840 [Bacilli bacterium]